MKRLDALLERGLIGANATLTEEKTGITFTGTIVDETQNMITLDHGKRFIKKQYRFELTTSVGKITIDGKDLVGRPEERIKKWLRKKRIGK